MSSWQTLVKEMALLCVRAAGEAVANETAQKIAKKLKTDPDAQKIQNQIMAGRGYEAASNVLQLFQQSSKDNDTIN